MVRLFISLHSFASIGNTFMKHAAFTPINHAHSKAVTKKKSVHGKCLVNLPNSVIWRFGCWLYKIANMIPNAVSTKQQQKQPNGLYAATGTK